MLATCLIITGCVVGGFICLMVVYFLIGKIFLKIGTKQASKFFNDNMKNFDDIERKFK